MNRAFSFGFLSAALLLVGFSSRVEAADLARDDLIRRLQIRADVLVLSEDGKKVVQTPGETRVFSGFSVDGKFKRDWSSETTDLGWFKIRHEWAVSPSGALKVRFEEFSEAEVDSRSGAVKDFKNPIHEEEKEITGFSAVNYAVQAIKGKRVVVRFVPELAAEPRLDILDRARISGKGIAIYDAEGVLWADGLESDANFVAFTTHRGTLMLSFQPFEGAEPSGIADGKRITVRMKDFPRVTLQSDRDFVTAGTSARVYAKYVREKRTKGLNSVWVQESSDGKKFIAKLK